MSKVVGSGAHRWWQLATGMEANHNNRSYKIREELPIEVLGIVFAYYVETETLFHPLETLLLVSRLWHLAALNHKALWGNLNIHMGHKPTHDAWKIIVPRRLERASSAPLSIEIRYALEGVDHPYYERTPMCAWDEGDLREKNTCTCVRDAAGCAQDLLEILAGPEGEHCKRWMKLHITLGCHYKKRHSFEVFELFRSALLCNPLSHPMPSLEIIHLKGIKVLGSASETPFPSTPSVRIVHLEQSTFDSLDGTNFSSAESITLLETDILKDDSKIFKLDPPTAIKVIHINGVELPFSMIPKSLPHLHTLRIGGYRNDLIDPDFDFPSLKTLTIPLEFALETHHPLYFGNLTSSTNRPLSTVKVLILPQLWRISRESIKLLKPFLDQLESIESITTSIDVHDVILKYIFEAHMQREGNQIWSNLSGRTLELVPSHGGKRVQLSFEETMRDEDIWEACIVFGLPDPRDEYNKLHRSRGDAFLP